MLQVTFSVLLSSWIFWSQSYSITRTQTHLPVAYIFLALYCPTFEVIVCMFWGVYCVCLSENDVQRLVETEWEGWVWRHPGRVWHTCLGALWGHPSNLASCPVYWFCLVATFWTLDWSTEWSLYSHAWEMTSFGPLILCLNPACHRLSFRIEDKMLAYAPCSCRHRTPYLAPLFLCGPWHFVPS